MNKEQISQLHKEYFSNKGRINSNFSAEDLAQAKKSFESFSQSDLKSALNSLNKQSESLKEQFSSLAAKYDRTLEQQEESPNYLDYPRILEAISTELERTKNEFNQIEIKIAAIKNLCGYSKNSSLEDSTTSSQHSGNCGFCKSSIPSDASVCRSCGAKWEQYNTFGFNILALIAFLAFCLGIIGILLVIGGKHLLIGIPLLVISAPVLIFIKKIEASRPYAWQRRT